MERAEIFAGLRSVMDVLISGNAGRNGRHALWMFDGGSRVTVCLSVDGSDLTACLRAGGSIALGPQSTWNRWLQGLIWDRWWFGFWTVLTVRSSCDD